VSGSWGNGASELRKEAKGCEKRLATSSAFRIGYDIVVNPNWSGKCRRRMTYSESIVKDEDNHSVS
jgi:hypothetical protein